MNAPRIACATSIYPTISYRLWTRLSRMCSQSDRSSTLQRIFAWFTFDRFVYALFLLIVFAASATTEFQSDTWWTLRAGQLTWRSGFVWTTDPLSSTAAGAYWPNHEWLSQVLFYVVYQVSGPGGLVLLCALVTTLTWIGLYQLCEGDARQRSLFLLLAVP